MTFISSDISKGKIENNLSRTFDFLRFPLALFVVYLHIAPTLCHENAETSIIRATYPVYYWINNSICTLANLAVPCFFIISGYLMSFNMTSFQPGIYLSKLYRRCFTLLIPYIIWNIACVIYLHLTGQIEYVPSWAATFIQPVNFPLWFLRNLIVLNLLYPVIWWMAARLKLPFLIFSFVLFSVLPLFCDPYSFANQTAVSLLMFYAGVFWGINSYTVCNFRPTVLISIIITGITAYIINLFHFLPISAYINNVYLLTGTHALIILSYLAVKHYRIVTIPILTSASFFIYVSHKLGPTYISKRLEILLPADSEITRIVIFLICPVIASGICVLTYYAMSKISPRFLKILTGK